MQKNRPSVEAAESSYYYVENWNKMRDVLKLLRWYIDDRIRLGFANGNITSKEAKRSAFQTLHGRSFYSSMPQWRKQHQAENSCHDENVLLLFHALKLADEKEAASLRGLSKGQVQEFLGRWNQDTEFRYEYQRSERTSLNSRRLYADGRMRNPDEGPTALIGQRIKLPNIIRKPLIRKRPTMPT